jgi:naphthalene 1,2-dioxygenase system ferredoxin subunit
MFYQSLTQWLVADAFSVKYQNSMRGKNMNSTWTDIMAADDAFDGEVVRVDTGNKNLAIYQVNGQIYCTDNVCTHGNALLSDGLLEGHEIECPFHQGRFDVRDGRVTCEPASKALKTYPIKISDGRVFVNFDV